MSKLPCLTRCVGHNCRKLTYECGQDVGVYQGPNSILIHTAEGEVLISDGSA